jgi:hypothetical protein
MLKVERGSTSSYCVENSYLKRLWTYRKTECEMNEKKHSTFLFCYRVSLQKFVARIQGRMKAEGFRE